MGYPRKYVGHYPWLVTALKNQGHAVYPMEMSAQPVFVKTGENYRDRHYLYGFVDVVSYFNGKLYAWEWKSEKDDPVRGIKQIENYARSFDFVSLVVQNLNTLDRVIKKKGLRVSTILKEMGAGAYWFDEDELKLIEEPKQQTPNVHLYDELLARFMRNVFPNEHAKIQRKLKSIEEREKFQKQHRLLTEFQ
jgi:hypothetical protein